MDNKIVLKDIIDILNSDIELYFKGSYVGDFSKEELRKTKWIEDRVVGLEADGVDKLCVYLSDYNRAF